eukprot:evm.model.scf_1216.1 EVM.evm.TU.scf_1216.1   scf_1216:16609-17625(-)
MREQSAPRRGGAPGGLLPDILSSCGLAFPDPELESLYESEVVSSFLSVDRTTLVMRAVLDVVLLVRLAMEGKLLSVHALAGLGCLLLPIVHAIRRHQQLESLDGRGGDAVDAVALKIVVMSRNADIAASRLCYALLLPMGYAGVATRTDTVAFVVVRLVLASGPFFVAAPSACMPLLLKYHLPLYATSVALMVLAYGPANCTALVHEETTARLVKDIWESVSWAFGFLLKAAFAADVHKMAVPGALAACSHITAMLYIVGLLLPTWLLFVWEHSSRRAFIRERLGAGEEWAPIARSTCLHLALATVLCLAIAWVATSWLYVEGGSTENVEGPSWLGGC